MAAGLAFYFSFNTLLAFLLWRLDTVILWIVGYLGFGMFLPLAIAAWISYFVIKAREAKGKPKPNVFAIYSGVTGSFLVAALTYGFINFDTDNINNSGKSFGYGLLTLFFIGGALFLECLITTICAVATKRPEQTPYNYAAYVNPQGNIPYNNMQGNMPYGNYPNYQGYPNQIFQGANAPYGDPRYNNYQGYQGGYPNYDQNNNYNGR